MHLASLKSLQINNDVKAVQYFKRKLPIGAPDVAEPGGCRSSELARVPNRRQTVSGMESPGSSEFDVAICVIVTVSYLIMSVKQRGLVTVGRS